MNRYAARFSELEAAGQGAFVSFVVIGDPTPNDSIEIMHTLVRSGSDMLELGFPFSDPLADGPVIQSAMHRALLGGMNPRGCFELIAKFRETDNRTPVGLLVYANIVHAMGLNAFFDLCAKSQVDSVLIADAPLGECRPYCEAAIRNGIDPVLICPPNARQNDIRQIAEMGRGYTYLLSRAGVTGTSIAAGSPVHNIIKELESSGAAPALLGFGISTPSHVSNALSCGARGVICGSAIVQRISEYVAQPENIHKSLGLFVREMKAATAIGRL
jgi:tryptophan synthase alpha chain